MHLKVLKAYVDLHEFSDLNLVQALRSVPHALSLHLLSERLLLLSCLFLLMINTFPACPLKLVCVCVCVSVCVCRLQTVPVEFPPAWGSPEDR